jgi:hypothetical protein
MTKSPQHTKQFVMLPRLLLESEAWRSLGINARRFLDFLMLEHMRHGGKENGSLLAPRSHLVQFGIGARYISPAIEETERLGLVDRERGVGRRPSLYALTWLPTSDGSAPSNRWRALVTSDGKSLQMTSQGKCLGYPKGSHKACSDFRREVTKPQNKGIPREAPYKKSSYQEGDTPKPEVGVEAESEVVSHVIPPEHQRELNPGRPQLRSESRDDRAEEHRRSGKPRFYDPTDARACA